MRGRHWHNQMRHLRTGPNIRMAGLVVGLTIGLALLFYFTQIRAPWMFFTPERHFEAQHGSIVYADNGRDYSQLRAWSGNPDRQGRVFDKTCGNGKTAIAIIRGPNDTYKLFDGSGGCDNIPGYHTFQRSQLGHRTCGGRWDGYRYTDCGRYSDHN